MSNWIYPFKGRNQSLAVGQNFLWNESNIYIMDNHRAALWCWMQHVKSGQNYGLFHIDAHYDAATISPSVISSASNIGSLSFDQFLNLSTTNSSGVSTPIVRWDNYLYLFQETHHSQIAEFFLATHALGTPPPKKPHWEEVHMSHLLNELDDYLNLDGHDGWILNIDLDYFFSHQSNRYFKLQSDHYISEIFRIVGQAVKSKRIACLTICLSPECCGGWSSAETICYQLCDEIGISFRLP